MAEKGDKHREGVECPESLAKNGFACLNEDTGAQIHEEKYAMHRKNSAKAEMVHSH